MDKREKLPENNPSESCSICGREYPVWRHYYDSQEGRWIVGHSFCPASISGQIVQLCLACKMLEIAGHWKKEKS